MKKLFTMLLALFAAFGITMNVSAEKNGEIIVNNTTSEKTYEIYRIFDLTLSDSGKVSYTIADAWENFFSTGAGKDYIVASNSGSLSSIVIDGVVKYINITDDNVGDFAQDALDYASKNSIDATASKVAEGTSLTFSGLDLGYYLVYPKGATDIKDSYKSICSLTSTKPTATVVVKATYPTIDKVVDETFVDVGQEVTFTITGTVPDTTGYSKYNYIIHDTMNSGLLFTEADLTALTVKFGDDTIATSANYSKELNGNGFDLTFDMTKYQDYVGKTITVTYKATVTESAVFKKGTNTVYLEYSNNPKNADEKEKTPEIEVPVYSAQINVDKVDGTTTSTKLSGAEFVLYKIVVENGENVKYYYQAFVGTSTTPLTKVSTTAGVTRVDWTTNIDAATVLVTDEDGSAEFEGVKRGTYYLHETKAPEGYNILTEDQTITVGYKDGEEIKDVSAATAVVKNYSGTELPSTGGMGTKIFITLGTIIAMTAAVILVTNKRMANEEL